MEHREPAGCEPRAEVAGAGPDAGAHPLEPSTAAMRDMVEAALQRILPYLETLAAQPAASTEGGPALARALAEPLPETGTPFSELLDLLFDRAVPCSFNTAGPGYLAYIPGGGLFHAAVADLIADSVNRYVGVFAAAPGLAQLEANVTRWLAEIVGFPPAARGILTSGGSLAAFTALVTARRERLPEEFLAGTLYVSDQVHHSITKAAILAGFPAANVRTVPSDARFRMRLDELERMLEEDRARGRQPFFVVGSAGTVHTGAVDPLVELAAIARRERLWFHVDGAYGGFFLLTEAGRRVLAGAEQADSIVLDPHKSLFLPYGTGAVVVRDGEALRRAHTFGAHYLPGMQQDPDLLDFSELSPELSRPFRGLRVWLPVKLLGIGAFRQALEEKLALARWLADELRATPGFEIVAEPELSLFAFRLRPPGIADDEGGETDRLNAINRQLLARVNARNRVHLTATLVGGRFVLRACVLSFRTHRDRVEAALADLRAAAAEILAAR